MPRFNRDPSIEHEPQYQSEPFQPDPRDPLAPPAANPPLRSGPFQPTVTGNTPVSIDDAVQHTVWDEPAIHPSTAGAPPKNALTYANWLSQRQADWPSINGWLLAVATGLICGPIAILFGLMGSWQFQFGFGLVGCLGVPLFHELLKVILLVWIVECRPFMLSHRGQIYLSCLLSAIGLSLIYTAFSLITDPWGISLPSLIVLITFPFIQIVSSLLIGAGLVTVWRNTMTLRRPPALSDGTLHFMLGIGIHVGFATGVVIWKNLIGF